MEYQADKGTIMPTSMSARTGQAPQEVIFLWPYACIHGPCQFEQSFK